MPQAAARGDRRDDRGGALSTPEYDRATGGVERRAEGWRDESIVGVRRRGKNILVELSGELTLHVHLKMTGNLYVVPDHRLRAAMVRAWFELEDGRALVFDDPRAIGRIRVYGAARSSPGEDGRDRRWSRCRPEFTDEVFVKMARKSRKPVKLFLLDQSHVAGIGNISTPPRRCMRRGSIRARPAGRYLAGTAAVTPQCNCWSSQPCGTIGLYCLCHPRPLPGSGRVSPAGL